MRWIEQILHFSNETLEAASKESQHFNISHRPIEWKSLMNRRLPLDGAAIVIISLFSSSPLLSHTPILVYEVKWFLISFYLLLTFSCLLRGRLNELLRSRVCPWSTNKPSQDERRKYQIVNLFVNFQSQIFLLLNIHQLRKRLKWFGSFSETFALTKVIELIWQQRLDVSRSMEN